MECAGDSYNISHRNRQKPLRNIETTKAHASIRRSELAAVYYSANSFDFSDICGCSERLPDAQSLPIS